MIDPRLNHVVAVARTGSFTAAADIVGVTQSAVTKSIADLEQQIGYLIFYRTSRGALLTEEGRHFVERAARLLEDAGELLRRHDRLEDAYAVTLRIGVCPASLEWQLEEPVRRLLAKHPALRFDISGANFERVVQQLRNGGIDVAFGFDAAFSEWPDLRRETLAANRGKLFVRKKHPLSRRKSISFKDLAEFDFVTPSDSRPYGAVIRGIYERQGIEWQRRLHVVDFFPTVRAIVAQSDAIGVAHQSHGQSEMFRRHFSILDRIELFEPAALCCAVRARWEAKPAVRAFIFACVQALGSRTS